MAGAAPARISLSPAFNLPYKSLVSLFPHAAYVNQRLIKTITEGEHEQYTESAGGVGTAGRQFSGNGGRS
ncbi:protein of unknown function [Serratia sp. Tan611]|nr:protein of unknown function [Serratia sp. Tan611]